MIASFAGLSESASAALILESLRYDGHVEESGVTGVEGHFRDFGPAGLAPNAAFQALPANVDPPAPLDPSVDLQLRSYVQLSDMLGPYAEIWVDRPTIGPLFVNDLDTMLGMPPIVLDAEVYLEELAIGEKLIFPHVGAELPSSSPPHPAPATLSISNNRGSADDPIHVVLGLTAAQANLVNVLGQAKVRLYFDTMIVPEPASIALVGLGCVGVLGLGRRRRSK